MTNNLADAWTDAGFALLLIATIGDLAVPFFLAPSFKGYRHRTMMMSLLGSRSAPLHSLYNGWLVATGVMLFLGGLKLYTAYAPVPKILSVLLLLFTALYAVGACILSGIFSVGEIKTLATLPEKIHGYGYVLGFFPCCPYR